MVRGQRNKAQELRCCDLVQLGLPCDAGIRMQVQENQEAPLFQQVTYISYLHVYSFATVFCFDLTCVSDILPWLENTTA